MSGFEKVIWLIWKGIRAFGLFWKNFIIGDAPEIALGVVIILIMAFLLRNTSLAAQIVIPLSVVILIISVVWLKTNK
jgi:hypothetical protein